MRASPSLIKIVGFLCISVCVGLGITGCSSSQESAAVATNPQQLTQAEAEIQRIKSDSRLNPQAKEQRIKQIELWQKQQRGGK